MTKWDKHMLHHITNNTGYAVYTHLDGRVVQLTRTYYMDFFVHGSSYE